MPVPPLPAGRRAAAVTKSVETRRARAEMLHALASGQASLADVLARTDDVARRTRVTQVLKALPGYGPVTVAAVMSEVGIAAGRRVGGLGARQRAALLTTAPHPGGRS